MEQAGYKQVIKSKTRSTETSIITQDQFFTLVNQMTQVRLSTQDIETLKECVQLTPKFSHLFTLKLLAILIQEVEQTNSKPSGGIELVKELSASREEEQAEVE